MKKYQEGIIVLTFSLFLYLLNINGLSIYTFDEARNAGCAAEMFQKSEWIVPTFNDELRTLKPPLHYYFMIVAYKIGGINPFTTRFFSSLFGAFTILLTFFFAHRYLGRIPAWWAVFVLWSSLHFNIQIHMAVPDPYLIFFMTLLFFLFFHFLQTQKTIHLYGMYIAMGLCVLLKGPFAILLPGLIFLRPPKILYPKAFIFDIQRPIKSLEQAAALNTFWEQNPEGFVITRKRYLKELENTKSYEVIFEQKDLFEISRTVILKKRPLIRIT